MDHKAETGKPGLGLSVAHSCLPFSHLGAAGTASRGDPRAELLQGVLRGDPQWLWLPDLSLSATLPQPRHQRLKRQ